VRVLSASVDPATGERQLEAEVIPVRLAVKQPTAYSRIIAASAVQRDIGDTTFLFWNRDVPFTTLQTEDYIIAGAEKYQVVSTYADFTIIAITSRLTAGSTGIPETKQQSQGMALQSTATFTITGP